MRCLHMCALGEISICIRDLCLEICLFREILSKNITLRGIFILMSVSLREMLVSKGYLY